MDWKAIIGAVAPTVATGLFGPAGGLIASIAGRVLMGNDKSTPQDVVDNVLANQNPETFAKLREIEAQTLIECRKLEIDLARINADDTDSARKREIAVRDKVPAILAAGVTIGFFGVLFWMLKFGLPKDVAGNEALLLMVGALGAAWGNVIGYYFGSSRGSATKDETIKAAVTKP